MGGRRANTERRWNPIQQRRETEIPRLRRKALKGGGIQTAVETDTIHPMDKAEVEEIEMILGTHTGKHLQKVTGRNLRHQIEVENLYRLTDTGGDHHLPNDTERNPWRERERNRLRKSHTGESHRTDPETLLRRDTIGQNRLLRRGEQLIISKVCQTP